MAELVGGAGLAEDAAAARVGEEPHGAPGKPSSDRKPDPGSDEGTGGEAALPAQDDIHERRRDRIRAISCG